MKFIEVLQLIINLLKSVLAEILSLIKQQIDELLNTLLFPCLLISRKSWQIYSGKLELYINCTDSGLTRFGARYRLGCLRKKATQAAPPLAKKNITSHAFQHTAALRMLQSGVDISAIAIWFGHESILTTHKYMEANMGMKSKTFKKISEPG
ncbi:hypothetical protein CDQ84_08620 [Clostridium thermosuccinogenes]|uniref:Tyr recombinase domain-containing protein n=1 Tax=Clostridium thermosuccinogenes TaxID=84032 RepID=A0A2K2FFC8_9CLOT|nr:hypothetical protein CDO33_14915 [Pseudoclostridium thermosuccinogenes]PNT93871.1 hypothetical protein CDQ83_10415 [Pseudoclostridium thermosuccinogenes]PNT97482.1 hypothetical protein CDQ85_08465 [Pseudoclostridium thermosuccinogenes]PNT99514.1 hypothetical protein CDQ84_08620 [Pseudoclostridium thermosuccinogenes]